MSDYTPTMARIEDMYAWAYAWRTQDEPGDGETDLSHLRETQRAEFQRALARHDRKIAAEALRGAADAFEAAHLNLDCAGPDIDRWRLENEVRERLVDSLRARADRIEQGGQE